MNLSEDKIANFLDACFAAGIKRPELFLISKMPQVYNYLSGCFPRGILPTDVDGEVEINGHFLRLEFKHEEALRNGRVPKGQSRALSALLDTGKFTVFLIGINDLGLPTCAEVWYPNRKIKRAELCDISWVRERCSAWSGYAESQERSTIEFPQNGHVNKPAAEVVNAAISKP